MKFVFATIAVLLVACASAEPVGSIGVVLGRDGESGEIFVREVPEPPPGVPAVFL